MKKKVSKTSQIQDAEKIIIINSCASHSQGKSPNKSRILLSIDSFLCVFSLLLRTNVHSLPAKICIFLLLLLRHFLKGKIANSCSTC